MTSTNTKARLAVAGILAFSLIGCTYNGAWLGNGVPSAARETGRDLTPPPEVVSSHGVATFTLLASIDPSNNLPTFVFQGDYDATPTIRVKPGDTIEVFLTDELPDRLGMGADVNLHFHGLGVSPNKPSDDVLTMIAKPGQSLHYLVKIPTSQPPGLYWYHTHVHGETNFQVGEGGMSGAIVIEGLNKRIPALAKMPERIVMLRALGTGAGDVETRPHGTPNTHPCAPGALITVNRVYQPVVRVKPGAPQFFRVVNATGHRTLDLSMNGAPMQIVAIDGYPVYMAPGGQTSVTQTHFVLPPAGRVEFVAVAAPSVTSFGTRCYFSGPVGDQDPPQTLLFIRAEGNAAIPRPVVLTANAPRSAPLPAPAADRVVVFTENNSTFFINGRAFEPSDPPTFVAHTGTVERWTVENHTAEVHDFHLHQVHFLVVAVDGRTVGRPLWRDTFVVPPKGKIVLLADFRNPVVRGTFLFHCHILDHEDKGMMAKIEVL